MCSIDYSKRFIDVRIWTFLLSDNDVLSMFSTENDLAGVGVRKVCVTSYNLTSTPSKETMSL